MPPFPLARSKAYPVRSIQTSHAAAGQGNEVSLGTGEPANRVHGLTHRGVDQEQLGIEGHTVLGLGPPAGELDEHLAMVKPSG